MIRMPLISAQGSSLVPATRSLGSFVAMSPRRPTTASSSEAKRPFGLPAILAEGNQLSGRVDGFGQVLQEIIEVPTSGGHRSIASSRMR